MTGTPSQSTSEAGGTRLPRAVRAAADRAAKLQAQQRERAGQPVDPSGDAPNGTQRGTQPAAEPAAVATPDAAPKTAPQSGVTTTEPQANGPEATAGATPAATGDGEQNGLFNGKTAKFWHDRYTSTLGVLRAERAQSQTSVDELADKLAEAQLQLATAKAQPKVPPKLDEFLSAEQIATLGEDRAAEILALAHRVAQEQVQTAVAAAVQPIKEREQRRNEREHLQQRQRVFGELTDAVPGWEAINASDDWQQWCMERDPKTGLVRQQVINAAMSDYNSAPLVNLFREFESTLPRPAVPPGAKPPVVPETSAGGGNTPSVPPPPNPDDESVPLNRASVKQLYTKLATRRDLSDAQRDAERKKLDERVKRAQETGQLR